MNAWMVFSPGGCRLERLEGLVGGLVLGGACFGCDGIFILSGVSGVNGVNDGSAVSNGETRASNDGSPS